MVSAVDVLDCMQRRCLIAPSVVDLLGCCLLLTLACVWSGRQLLDLIALVEFGDRKGMVSESFGPHDCRYSVCGWFCRIVVGAQLWRA
jgi:hypothetical protein